MVKNEFRITHIAIIMKLKWSVRFSKGFKATRMFQLELLLHISHRGEKFRI